MAALAIHALLLWAIHVGLSQGEMKAVSERADPYAHLELWLPLASTPPSPVGLPAKQEQKPMAALIRPNPSSLATLPPSPAPMVQQPSRANSVDASTAPGVSVQAPQTPSPVTVSPADDQATPSAGIVDRSPEHSSRVASVQSQPVQVLHGPKPAYPGLSRRLAEEGTVWLRIDVMANGQVALIEVIQSSGHRRLDQAALTQLKSWRFSPAMLDGHATAASLEVPVAFKLNGD
jgi:protein TonB